MIIVLEMKGMHCKKRHKRERERLREKVSIDMNIRKNASKIDKI